MSSEICKELKDLTWERSKLEYKIKKLEKRIEKAKREGNLYLLENLLKKEDTLDKKLIWVKEETDGLILRCNIPNPKRESKSYWFNLLMRKKRHIAKLIQRSKKSLNRVKNK